jgi:L-asparaginase
LLLHGGAGPEDSAKKAIHVEELTQIARQALKRQTHGSEVILSAIKGMEDSENYNAGRGAALQSDGLARLTAAYMNGAQQTFSAVISTPYLKNPIELAESLQTKSSRVLTVPGSELLARELGHPIELNLTNARVARWAKRVSESGKQWDTVGATFFDGADSFWAGTSTGGRGFEVPGRVSDSGTVAGNFASRFAAVSATGIGEQIVDAGLAVRLETRVRDGSSLRDASRRCFQEAQNLQHQYGWIAVSNGSWAAAYTTPGMIFVAMAADGSVLAHS